jgi:hypothetical protein
MERGDRPHAHTDVDSRSAEGGGLGGIMTQLIYPDLSISGEQQIVQGSVADWTIMSVASDGTPLVFASGDTVASFLYQGGTEAALFSPTTIWTPPTGYLTGMAQVSPTSVQSAGLDPNGDYILQIWWTSSDTTRKACIARQTVRVLPGPGITVQTIVPYCQLADMLRYADWITTIQDTDTDQEAFYPERILARNWMDEAVINGFRGSYVGLFEGHSLTAFAFGNTGWRRSVGPSPSLMDYLESNFLIVDPYIVRACAYKAIAILGQRQMGQNNQLASIGALFEAKASREMSGITACININNNPLTPRGTFFINLNSTNTLMT